MRLGKMCLVVVLWAIINSHAVFAATGEEYSVFDFLHTGLIITLLMITFAVALRLIQFVWPKTGAAPALDRLRGLLDNLRKHPFGIVRDQFKNFKIWKWLVVIIALTVVTHAVGMKCNEFIRNLPVRTEFTVHAN